MFRFVAILAFLCALCFSTSRQESEQQKITCYDFNGTSNAYKDNYQCPGSNACCADVSICRPNRYCQQGLQLVRSPCSKQSWDKTCSNLCHYTTGTGFLPRIVTCKDGSFCCDNDPSCCSKSRGVVLDGVGGIVSTNSPKPSTTSTSTSSSSSSTSSSTSISSSTSTSPPTSAAAISTSTPTAANIPVPTPSSSHAQVIGAVVGSVLGVSIIAAPLFIWQRRRMGRLRSEDATQSHRFLRGSGRYELTPGQSYGPGYMGQQLMQTEPAELTTGNDVDRTVMKAELPAEMNRTELPDRVDNGRGNVL